MNFAKKLGKNIKQSELLFLAKYHWDSTTLTLKETVWNELGLTLARSGSGTLTGTIAENKKVLATDFGMAAGLDATNTIAYRVDLTTTSVTLKRANEGSLEDPSDQYIWVAIIKA